MDDRSAFRLSLFGALLGVERRWSRAGTVLVCAVLVFLSACTVSPLLARSEATTPLVLSPATLAGVSDARGHFREVYCALNERYGRNLPDYRPCERALWRLGKEPPGSPAKPTRKYAPVVLKVYVVPGILAECMSHLATTLSDALAYLRAQGYDAELISVSGRGGSANNARAIRQAIVETKLARNERILLVGHSKGIVDILDALATFPELESKVAAVVSLAGAVNGSPLADGLVEPIKALLANFPFQRCAPGAEGIEDLYRGNRMLWLALHPLPKTIHYYSIAAFTTREEISGILQPWFDKLNRVDPRNDGQLLYYDQIIPGATLLGYARADHWAIALPLQRNPKLSGMPSYSGNAFPREILLQAVIKFIEADLAVSISDR